MSNRTWWVRMVLDGKEVYASSVVAPDMMAALGAAAQIVSEDFTVLGRTLTTWVEAR